MAAGNFSFGNGQYVAAPSVAPGGRGLLFAAEVRTVGDGASELRGYRFDSDAAETTVGVVAFNGSLDNTNSLTDNTDNTQVKSDDPFTVYGSYGGVMPIRTTEAAQARATTRLALGEGIGVERGFWTGTLAKHANGNVLNGGTPVSAKLGLGLLLEWAAKNYAGVPFLHAGVRAANELAGLQLVNLPDEGVPSAKGGGILIPGAGYYDTPAVNTAADGSGTAITPSGNTVWLFASGRPLLYRGPVGLTAAPDWAHNQTHAFAMRTYVPSVDGLVGAVQITLT